MKRLLLILILTLSFQSWTKADDIRDFQIEGMSIGDSLLDHFSKDEIQLYINHQDTFHFKDKEYVIINTHGQKPYKKVESNYSFGGVTIKLSDTEYQIQNIGFVLRLKNGIKECHIKKSEIEESIALIFKDAKKESFDKKHSYDKTGNSKVYSTWFTIDNGTVAVHCEDWSKKLETEKNYFDRLKVTINSKQFDKYLQTAYE